MGGAKTAPAAAGGKAVVAAAAAAAAARGAGKGGGTGGGTAEGSAVHSVLLYERNGLRHGGFELPGTGGCPGKLLVICQDFCHHTITLRLWMMVVCGAFGFWLPVTRPIASAMPTVATASGPVHDLAWSCDSELLAVVRQPPSVVQRDGDGAVAGGADDGGSSEWAVQVGCMWGYR